MAVGELFHSIRYADATWQPWGNVSHAVQQNPGLFQFASCATVGNDLHIIAVTNSGDMYHTIRHTISWQPWSSVTKMVADNPGKFYSGECAGVGDDLHVIGVTASGELYHTIRYTKLNSWQAWGNVTQVVANNPGNLHFKACAGIGNELHLLGRTYSSGELYHAIHFADGHWQPWHNITPKVGGLGTPQIICAGIGEDLHIVGGGSGATVHTIRDSVGVWQAWDDAPEIINLAGTEPLSCASVGCGNCMDLHLLDGALFGSLYHTIRFTNKWQAWVNVASKIANAPSNGSLSTHCAGIGNELHIIGIEGP